MLGVSVGEDEKKKRKRKRKWKKRKKRKREKRKKKMERGEIAIDVVPNSNTIDLLSPYHRSYCRNSKLFSTRWLGIVDHAPPEHSARSREKEHRSCSSSRFMPNDLLADAGCVLETLNTPLPQMF